MRTYVVGIALSSLVGCATTVTSVPIQYELVDHPDEGRIEILYRNRSDITLCLSATDWPNAAGKLNQMGDRVFLVVDGERFSIENFNTGYCIGNACERRVSPGEQLAGSISYKDFDLPERLWGKTKSLEFTPQAGVADFSRRPGGAGCAVGFEERTLNKCERSMINVALVLRSHVAESVVMHLTNAALSSLGYGVAESGYVSPNYDCHVEVVRSDATHVTFIRYSSDDDLETWMEDLKNALNQLIEERGLDNQVVVGEAILLLE